VSGFRGRRLTLYVIVLMRFGVVSLATAFFVQKLLEAVPIGTDFSAWYAGSALSVLATILGASAIAFRIALAGRPVFQGRLLED
jgi:hypothetical protein